MTEQEIKSQLSGQKTKKRRTTEVCVEMAERAAQASNQMKLFMDSWAPPRLCVQGCDPRQLSKDTKRRSRAQTSTRAPLSGAHSTELQSPARNQQRLRRQKQEGNSTQSR